MALAKLGRKRRRENALVYPPLREARGRGTILRSKMVEGVQHRRFVVVAGVSSPPAPPPPSCAGSARSGWCPPLRFAPRREDAELDRVTVERLPQGAMLHSAVLNVMIKAAHRAGRALKRDLGEVEKLQVSLKGPGNFVTAADRRAEEIVREELAKARPNYGFLGEEGGSHAG